MRSSVQPEQSRRYAELLRLARTTLLSDGIDGFVMRRIAERAGMKLGNLQYYFATRDDLLEAILRAEHDTNFAQISTETQLYAVIEALIEHHGDPERSVYASIGTLAVHNRQLMAAWAEIHQQIYGLISGLIQNDDSSTTPSQARVRSILVMAAIEGAQIQVYRSTGATSAQSMSARLAQTALAIAKSA